MEGSNLAFEQLMQRYEKLVYWIAISWTKNPDTALDLSQDIFLKTYRNLASFKASGSFKAWLSTLAGRECASWHRKNKSIQTRIEALDQHDLAIDGDQELGLEHREKVGQLYRAFCGLNTRQQLAISLRYFERQSTRDLASALECSEGVAKSILFRSVKKLRQALLPNRSE